MPTPLILIDGFSLVFRAYHALSRTEMQSATGEPTFAVFAFANILVSLLDKHKPDAIAVAFDTREPTFRHVMYKEYKANRDAFPEDLVPQVERIKAMIDLMGIAQVELPGFEADDIVGTIAHRESKAGNEVLCVTSDKDYFQLVDENVKILRPGKDSGTYDLYDADKVKEKFGVIPEQVIDVLALIGDASDNVPGAKGIGPKTAIPLVEQYGSVEAIYENIDAIEKNGVRTKLEASKDNAMLSKTLVTINLNVPIEQPRNVLVRKDMQFQAIDELCAELGFTTLRKRFATMASMAGVELKESDVAYDDSGDLPDMPDENSPLQTIEDVKHSYTLVDTEGGLEEVVKGLKNVKEFCVDLETTGLDAMACAIVGVAICVKEGEAWYIDVDDDSDREDTPLFGEDGDRHGLPVDTVISQLKPYLESPKAGKIGQNLKYDSLVLKRYNVNLSPISFDTMLASYVLESDKKHGMDALAERWLSYSPISIKTLIGEKKSEQKSMRDIDASVVAEYAGEDADVTLKLANILRPRLEKEGLMALAKDIEFPVEEVLVDIEHAGVCVNTDALEELSVFMRSEATRLEKEIFAEAGKEFTINSPKQLGVILFEDMMLPAKKKTKSGFSTDSSVLTELAETFPIAQMVLDYRQVEKLRSTYVESLPRMINAKTGRVHTTFNQTVAATGRLSSTDPNLQNIPIRTELGLQIRKAFVPQKKGSVILSADYSQIELRIMASMSKDKVLVDAFQAGEDIHAATASALFGTGVKDVSGDQRRIAKTVNFGIMYGLGAFGLAQRLGISRTEGKEIIDNYFETYPGIRAYMDNTIATTRDRGYAETMCGRRRHFPLISSSNKGLQASSERAAINMPIQGTAADMMKIAMINVHKRLAKESLNALMMLQVHDELLFEVDEAEVAALTTLVREEMIGALELPEVPIVVDVGSGASWYEAH